mgnify:CR=1 FL=1
MAQIRLSGLVVCRDEAARIGACLDALAFCDEVVVAADGRSGLALATEQRFALVVLDLRLPGIDGLEVLRRCGPIPTSVIVLTGHGCEEDRERCMQLGAFAYLQKPLDINVLSETIQKANEKIRLKKGKKD